MAWGNKSNATMAKSQESESNSINIIGSGTAIIGDIKSNGDIRIDGSVEGNIDVKGKLVVGSTGKVKGKVRCKNSDVSGRIDGEIFVEELLSLKASAQFYGEITTDKLSIEPGAKFTGECKMGKQGGGMQSTLKSVTEQEKNNKPNEKK